MNTKTIASGRSVKTKQISYYQLSELLLKLHVELSLMAATYPEDDKTITASNFSTNNSQMFHFEDKDFSLSLDLMKKGGVAV